MNILDCEIMVLRPSLHTGVLEIAPDAKGKGRHVFRCSKHARETEKMNKTIRFQKYDDWVAAGRPSGELPTWTKADAEEAAKNPKSLTSRTNPPSRRPKRVRRRPPDDDGPESLRSLLRW